MSVLIKRYANRKLYNTDTSRYITLKGIAELLDGGHEVQVVDNETGEDITHVALSQILVDSKRSHTSPPHTLLSQILGRGGDALYGALRKGVDEATDGLGEFQDRVRRMVGADDETGRDDGRRGSDGRGARGQRSHPVSEFEHLIQASIERVFRVLDLPRRSDIDALNDRLDRVAEAVEALQRATPTPHADAGTEVPPPHREGEPGPLS